jgi:peptide deformylase
MIKPIVAYDSPVLRLTCRPANANTAGLKELIADLWDTARHLRQSGLAAPQINIPLRVFVIDSIPEIQKLNKTDQGDFFADDTGVRETFINPEIIYYSRENTWLTKEASLCLPDFDTVVPRAWNIKVKYCDAEFQTHMRSFAGLTAKLIQHAYEHLEGILFLDHINASEKQRIPRSLIK